MNFPNLITVFRLLLVPLLVIFLLENKPNLALATFVVAGVSDALDGFLARVLKQKTLLGAYIDPLADKLLLTTSYIALAILEQVPGWLSVVVVSRDVIILGGIGVLMLNNRHFVIEPTLDSKTTTFFQLVTVCFFLGREYVADYWYLNTYLVIVTALLTLFSGFHYLLIGFEILSNSDQNQTEK